MPESTLKIGDPIPGLEDGHWILLLGGVSRVGNRRARRFAPRATENNGRIVWIDGFEETWDDSGERVDLPPEVPPESVVVVGYRDEERKFLLNRLSEFVPRLALVPGTSVASRLDNSKRESVARLGLRIRSFTRQLGEALRSKFLGKLAAAFRGRAGYKIVRTHLHELASYTSPSAIIYCDDYALTIAWHAARIWPDVPVLSGLPD